MSDDFSKLSDMVFSGDGITLGITPEGNPFIGYTLTGQSPSSQARELIRGPNTGIIRTGAVEDDKTLTEMFDIKTSEELAKLKADIAGVSKALIIYPAVMPVGNRIVVSNGAQTNLLYDLCKEAGEQPYPEAILRSAMRIPKTMLDEKNDEIIDITSYEPDKPNFTPRICGCVDKNGKYAFYIVKKDGDKKDIESFPFDPKPGVCHTLTTYKGGNEKPLLSFEGKPLEGRVESDTAYGVVDSLYKSIGNPNPNDGKVYRVAAAVIVIKPKGLETAIYNFSDGGNQPQVFFQERK